MYNEPDRLVEITEFGQFDNGRWYPKKCERTSWRMNKDGQIVNKHYETFTAYVTNNPVFADDTFNPESIAAHVLAYRPIKEKNDRLNRQKSIDKYKQSPEYQQELNKALSCSFEEAISIIDNNESGVEPKELVEAYLFDRTNKLYHRMAILWPGSGAWINQIAEEVPVDFVVGEQIENAEGFFAVPYASKEFFEELGRYNQ